MNSRFLSLKSSLKFTPLASWQNINARQHARSYSLIEHIVKSPAPYLTFPKGNFVNILFKDVDKWRTNIAIECSETGKTFTYSQLQEQSARWSGYLKQIDITKGDVVSIISPNCMQYGPIFIGTAAIGAVLSPIDWKNSVEILRIIEVNKPKVLIFSSEAEPNLSKSFKDDSKGLQLLSLGKPSILKAENVDDILYGDQKVQPLDPVELTGDEAIYMPFSSGTTGLPKAVDHCHNSFISAIYQYTNPYHELTRQAAGSFQEIVMAMFPLFHIYGLVNIFCINIYLGGKVVMVSRFDPKTLLGSVHKHKVSLMYTVPTVLNVLNNSPDCNPETMKHVEYVVCGASKVAESAVRNLRKKSKNDFHLFEIYGMTEMFGCTATPRRLPQLGNSGQLLSNIEGKILSTETGEALGPNEEGEVCIRTPSAMRGYINNLKATNETLVNGWVHTGDVGYFDEDGQLHLVDRTKDLIKVYGMQVSPSEIEEQLQLHPSVKECCVIGKPDELAGEFPVGFVVLKDKAQESELHAFLENKLSAHKRLQGGILFVEDLPKSQMGKVLRKDLRMLL